MLHGHNPTPKKLPITFLAVDDLLESEDNDLNALIEKAVEKEMLLQAPYPNTTEKIVLH
jgi:hypothetical protein